MGDCGGGLRWGIAERDCGENHLLRNLPIRAKAPRNFAKNLLARGIRSTVARASCPQCPCEANATRARLHSFALHGPPGRHARQVKAIWLEPPGFKGHRTDPSKPRLAALTDGLVNQLHHLDIQASDRTSGCPSRAESAAEHLSRRQSWETVPGSRGQYRDKSGCSARTFRRPIGHQDVLAERSPCGASMGTRQSLEAAQIEKGRGWNGWWKTGIRPFCAAWWRKRPWLKGEIP